MFPGDFSSELRPYIACPKCFNWATLQCRGITKYYFCLQCSHIVFVEQLVDDPTLSPDYYSIAPDVPPVTIMPSHTQPLSSPATSTAPRSYICNKCGQGFKKVSHLQAHERIHTGERPYICETCGASFITAFSLARHRTAHQEPRFTCNVCRKKFLRLDNWQNHERYCRQLCGLY